MKHKLLLLIVPLLALNGCKYHFHTALNDSNKALFDNAILMDSIFSSYDFYKNTGIDHISSIKQNTVLFVTHASDNDSFLLIRSYDKYIKLDRENINGLGVCYVTKSESLPPCEGTWSYDTIAINPNNNSELLLSKKVQNARLFYSIIKTAQDTNLLRIREYCISTRSAVLDSMGLISLYNWQQLNENEKQKYLMYDVHLLMKNNIVESYGEIHYYGECECEIYSKMKEEYRSGFRRKHLSDIILKILFTFWLY